MDPSLIIGGITSGLTAAGGILNSVAYMETADEQAEIAAAQASAEASRAAQLQALASTSPAALVAEHPYIAAGTALAALGLLVWAARG